MEILKKDNNVNRIYFISDIHIKNDASYNDKYYSVFENLFEKYKKEKVNKDDLIVITGDIMDNGYAVSGNAIEMAKNFYINLSNFCPVVSILGNHDLKTNVDTLTPIVKEHLKTKHELYFLLDTKIYIYGNIAFGHTKMGESEVINCKKYNKNYTTISLYHGMLKGAKLDNGIECRDNLLISQFKDYKYCAFGDIHKMQYLRKDKSAFYTGSLIAQKISEDAFEHGTMKLDLNKEKVEFIEIQNDYKKINLILDDDGNVSNYDLNKILKSTKFADLQLTFGNCGEKNINNLKKKFEDNQIVITNFLQKPQIENLTFDTVLKIDDKEIKLSSVVDKKTCSEFLLKYIEATNKIENKERFLKNLNLLLDDINFTDIMKKKRDIQIINIEINNILTFGEDVKIDIDKFVGIVGMCETNSSGKTSTCETISLGLFGETPRCKTTYSFIRNGQKEGYCIIRLISNGIEYEIKRIFSCHTKKDIDGKKANDILIIKKYINKKKNMYNEYVKIDDDSKKMFKNKDVIFKSKNEMMDIINNEIITYDELYQMMIISQNREKSFLEEKNKDELLFKIGNLEYLKLLSLKSEKMYSTVKDSIKDTLKKYCSSEFTEGFKKSFNQSQSYEYSKNKLNEYEKEINEYDNIKNNKNKNIQQQYNNKLNELIRLKECIKIYKDFEVIDDNYDIIELNEDNKDLVEKINKLEKELKEYDNNIEKNEEQIDIIKQKIIKYGNIEEKYNNFYDREER